LPEIVYPSVEEIIETNRRVLERVITDKRDRHVVWSQQAVRQVLSATKRTRGDVYDKAATLLVGLVKRHPFKSGNRRTAVAITSYFLAVNHAPTLVPADTEVLAKLRLGIYKKGQIAAWLKGHGIEEERR
jgi:prophage maintenance system killer protein